MRKRQKVQEMPWDRGLTGNLPFFSLEGVDGSGKSTQLALLIEHFQKSGRTTISVREPGGTPVSNAIRALLLDPANDIRPTAELLLYSAARAQLVESVIAPALQAGKIVLADRFGWSTLAYQGFGRGLDQDVIRSLLKIACNDVWPTHSFLLDISVSAMRARLEAGGRPADRMERESQDFFTRVREGYLSIAAQNSQRFTVLDGAQAPEHLHRLIVKKLADFGI